MNKLGDLLHKLADRVGGSHREGDFWNSLRKVQVRSIEDLRAIGDAMSDQAHVRYFMGGRPSSIEQIAAAADSKLDFVNIVTYDTDPGEYPPPGGIAAVWIANKRGRAKHMNGNGSPMQIHVQPGASMTSTHNIRDLSFDKVLEAARRSTKTVWRPGDYPAVKTITKQTKDQQEHDIRLQWKAGIISAIVSIFVAVGTTGILRGLFP